MQNFFTLFNLKERFDIDLQQLDTIYFALQMQYHPDRCLDANMGLLVNEGYKILKDNFARANHILELHGIFITNNKLAPKLPPEKLEQILDIIENKCDAIPGILDELTKAFAGGDYNKAAVVAMELRYLERGGLSSSSDFTK